MSRHSSHAGTKSEKEAVGENTIAVSSDASNIPECVVVIQALHVAGNGGIRMADPAVGRTIIKEKHPPHHKQSHRRTSRRLLIK